MNPTASGLTIEMKRKFLITGIVVGCLLTLGPVLSMLGTVFGMHRAFDQLGKGGMHDPEQLSAEIGSVLFYSIAGWIALPIGMLLLGFCIFCLMRQRQVPPPLPAADQ
jgi:biopolymer transport protein ExbB/TolQ